MTKEEAIKLLSQIRDALLASNSWLPSTDNPIKESFGMAIEALQERPEGKWKKKLGTLYCSICGNSWSDSFEHLLNKFNYCPNCGNPMKGKKNE